MSGQGAFAIVPAAGVGQRMRSDLPKQYLPLAGATVIEQTLKVLLDCPVVERVIVGVGAQDTIWRTLSVCSHPKIDTVTGGRDRAETVFNCLSHIADQDSDRWVMVHDAVRPCIGGEEILSLWDALEKTSVGGLLATPLVDTIKRAQDGSRIVAATLDRSDLWAARTPQMFRHGELLTALRAAREKGLEVTDEASAIEAVGARPRLVTGSAENIKITRPEDLPLAEFYLGRRCASESR